ncbi:MAG: hypothetical protein HFJ12_03700 [Bacilli bacterium]|nr:hypothetical protein [Bacilli bacterium]
MKKKAIVKIETEDSKLQERVEVEIKNGKINYLEKDKTAVLLELENKILIRENPEIYMELNLKEEKGNIYIKSLQKNIAILLELKKMDISKNKIEVQYEVEKELYFYKLEMED